MLAVMENLQRYVAEDPLGMYGLFAVASGRLLT